MRARTMTSKSFSEADLWLIVVASFRKITCCMWIAIWFSNNKHSIDTAQVRLAYQLLLILIYWQHNVAGLVCVAFSKNGPLTSTFKAIIKIMDFFLLNWRSIDYMMIWIIVAYKLCRRYLANRKKYVSVSGREQFDLCLVLHMEYKQNNKNALTVLYASVVNIRWSKKKSALVNEMTLFWILWSLLWPALSSKTSPLGLCRDRRLKDRSQKKKKMEKHRAHTLSTP